MKKLYTYTIIMSVLFSNITFFAAATNSSSSSSTAALSLATIFKNDDVQSLESFIHKNPTYNWHSKNPSSATGFTTNETPLISAAKRDAGSCIAYLFSQGIMSASDLVTPESDKGKLLAIHYAAAGGYMKALSILTILMQQMLHPTVYDLVMNQMTQGKTSSVPTLMSSASGQKVTIHPTAWGTPLQYAMHYNKPKAIQFLTAVQPSTATSTSSSSKLSLKTIFDNDDVISLAAFVRENPTYDWHAMNGSSSGLPTFRTPLMSATIAGAGICVAYLYTQGILSAIDLITPESGTNGLVAIHYAAARSEMTSLSALTILMQHMISPGIYDIVMNKMTKGSNPQSVTIGLRDNSGHLLTLYVTQYGTPLEYAAHYQKPDAIALLTPLVTYS